MLNAFSLFCRSSHSVGALLLVLFARSLGAQQPVPQTRPASHAEITAFEQHVAYWTSEPGWRTELQLRNNLDSNDLTVTPALRTADGSETALPAVTIKSGEVVSLDLYDALTKAAPQPGNSWGSLVLRYRAVVYHALYAAVMVRAVGRPIAFSARLGKFRTRYDQEQH